MAVNFGIERILEVLPDAYAVFAGSEYPMPVSQAMLGEMPDVARLRQWLVEAAEGDLKDVCEPVAVAAEVIESKTAGRGEYFIDDDRVRKYVFRGAKWRAGWVLLAGSGITNSLVQRLKSADYMVFSAHHTEMRDQALPPRETGAIYFLQLMVRYAMIWAQIPPGEDHEMGHFLEQDMPGAMVVFGEIGPVEGLVLLALMKMGCPAVVDAAFPYDIGPRAVVQNDDEVLEALGGFPNMRVRLFRGEVFSLPEGIDPANRYQKVQPARSLRGLFQLRPDVCESGVEVVGDSSDDAIAVIVEVADAKLDLPISAHLEAEAVHFGSYLPGVKTHRDHDGTYLVELAEGVILDRRLLGDVIYAGLRRACPRIGSVHVRVAGGQAALERERIAAQEFEAERAMAILAESEETVDEFHLCIDCQPFSHSHVCVITPDRPPMCGRSRNEIKTAALWGADYRPWTRRAVGGVDLQRVVELRDVINRTAGEWASLNAAVQELTGGRVERVQIHTVGKWPHTSCGCFGALAFRIPEMDGIGVMHRGYVGSAPGGLTWSILANRAGGKQAAGVTGITLNYLKSPRAFAGEGGLLAVKWATKKAFDIMEPYLPRGVRVATEEEAVTLSELKAFLTDLRP